MWEYPKFTIDRDKAVLFEYGLINGNQISQNRLIYWQIIMINMIVIAINTNWLIRNLT